MKIYTPVFIMLTALAIFAFLLHVDHRTLVHSQGNLGKDSTFQTFIADRDMKILPRPGWGNYLLCNEWRPLLDKSNFKIQDDKLILKITKKPMQTILRSIKCDLSKVDVRLNFEGISGFDQLEVVLKVIYTIKKENSYLAKSTLSKIHQIIPGSNSININLPEAEWGFFEVIIINKGEETNLTIGNQINTHFTNH